LGFRPRDLAYCARQDLDLGTFASVEAQIAALADDIAYNNHDVDFGNANAEVEKIADPKSRRFWVTSRLPFHFRGSKA
jgi:dGTP triphosphohydrolase